MKAPALARPGRIVRLATALLLLAVTSALAAGRAPSRRNMSPPPDSLHARFLYIQSVTVGHSKCDDDDDCPPLVCPDQPVPVTVRGQFPSSCYTFRGLHVVPGDSGVATITADIVVDTCANCTRHSVTFQGSVELPGVPPGAHAFMLREQARRCPDTTSISAVIAQSIPYRVQASCGNPPPSADSLVKTFASLRIAPAQPCAGDSVTLELVKNGCPPCVHLASFTGPAAGDSATFQGAIDWTPTCTDSTCVAESLSTPIGRFAAGSFVVNAAMTAHVHGTSNPDSTIHYVLTLRFEVGPPCNVPPSGCVAGQLQSLPPGQCSAEITPGGSGDLTLFYASGLAMGGAQGTIAVPAPFKLTDLKPASGVAGAHVSWTADGRGARWLVFTDPGVTLGPGVRQPLLDAVVAADSGAKNGATGLMAAVITLASDSVGHELPLCPSPRIVTGPQLCVVGESAQCDVNHDGRLDVRDLVRMVGCLLPGHDTTATSPCVDCDSSGVFDIADIFCCAHNILRGPLVPPDSVRGDANVSVTFDPVEASGSDLLVRVHVLGAHTLGAALVRLDYPAATWRASIPASLASGARPVDADWYPIADVSEPGRIHLGALRLGDSGSDDVTFELYMTSIGAGSPPANEQLQMVGADLAARSGGVVTPMGALPSIALKPGATEGGGTLDLSAARPNPFKSSTTFSVRLPSSSQVDLAVHDLAGRRVATLAHAVYGAGQHTFTWNGAGVHDGLYFVRLKVNGQVLSTRVALLRDSR